MQTFNLTRLETVISGAGSISAIGAELDKRGVRRAVVVTSASLGRSALLERVTRAMGPRCAGVNAGAAQHAPQARVQAVAAMLEALDADAIVSFGGGSAIDTGKAASASRLNGRDMTEETSPLDLALAFGPATGTGPGFPHIAVPTTLSAGSFTPGGGVTLEGGRGKRSVIDPRLQPCVVIHDPELCVETPDRLWISTGIRALDHAVEAIYSRRAHPLTTALAVRAIRMLFEHLPPSLGADAASVGHRGQCLDAAWLSNFGSFNTGLGLSHAVSHQIGPAWDVPHGITSCLTLAPSMRFIAGIAPQRFCDIAEGLGLPFDPASPEPGALACADKVEAFVAGFGMPTRLKQMGIAAEDIERLAEPVQRGLELFDATDRPLGLEEIRGLLREVRG